MAENKDPVLGTEEQGFWGNLGDAALGVVENVGEAGLAAGEFISEKILEPADNYLETVPVIGKLFSDNEETKLKESNVISQKDIDDAEALSKGGLFDEYNMLFSSIKEGVSLRFNKDIQDKDAFRQMQETQKLYDDELYSIQKKLEEYRNKPKSLSSEIQKQIDDEISRLESLEKQKTDEHNEQYMSLLNKAIKGTSLQDKQEKLKSIYEGGQSVDTLPAIGNLRKKYSEEADEFVKMTSREFAQGEVFNDNKFMRHVANMQQGIANELAEIKIRKIKAIDTMQKAGVPADEIETFVSRYNQWESLYKDASRAALKGAYTGVDGDSLSKVILSELGEDKVNNLIRIENDLTAELETNTGLYQAGITGGIKLIGGVLSTGISKLKQIKDEAISTTDNTFSKDFTELTQYDKDGINKILSWTWANKDDIFLNVGGVIGGSAVGAGAARGALALGGNLKWTAGAVNKLNEFSKSSKVFNFLLNNRFAGIKQMGTNVVTGLIPGQMIDTALNDPTSEERILLNMTEDVLLGPVVDYIGTLALKSVGLGSLTTVLDDGGSGKYIGTGGMGKGLSKTADEFLGINRTVLTKKIGEALGVNEKQAESIFKNLEILQSKSRMPLKSDEEVVDFVKNLIENPSFFKDGATMSDGIIARLRKESDKVSNLESGLSEELRSIAVKKDIDLNKMSVDSVKVDRLFKQLEIQVNNSKREDFLNTILRNAQVDDNAVSKNQSELIRLTNKSYDLAVGIIDNIKRVRDAGVLKADDIPLLNRISELQKNINDIYKKFTKERQYVDLRNTNGEEISVEVTDLKVNGSRISRASAKESFSTETTLYNELKNNKIYSGDVPDNTVSNFIRSAGGDGEGFVLNKEQVEKVQNILSRIFGIRPQVLTNKEDLAKDKSLVVIFNNNGLYRIYIGNKYTDSIDLGTGPVKVKINKSGTKFETEKEKELNKNKGKIKETYTVEEKKYTGLTGTKIEKIEKTRTRNKKTEDVLKEITVTKDSIKTGEINHHMWNRILFNTKPYMPEEFDDMIKSETIRIQRLISSKSNILDNALTLKDAIETKTFVKNRLRRFLSPVEGSENNLFNEVELEKFLELLDETIFSVGSLNLLEDFARSLNKSIDKTDALANIMESLGLMAAHNFKNLDIALNYEKIIKAANNERSAKLILSDLLMGENPTNILHHLNVKGIDSRETLINVEKITGIKIDNPLLKVSEADIEKFLNGIYEAKVLNGDINIENIPEFKRDIREKLTTRVILARDNYYKGLMREVFQGGDGIEALIRRMKDEQFIKKGDMTPEELVDSTNFENAVINAKNIDELRNVAKMYETTKKTEQSANQYYKKAEELKIEAVKKADISLFNEITTFNKIVDSVNLLNTRTGSTAGTMVFEENSFYTGDNIVTKSISYMFNPYTRNKVYDEELSSKISDMLLEKVKLDDGRGIHQVTNELRSTSLDEVQRKKLEDELDVLTEKLHIFLNPKVELKRGKTGKANLTKKNKDIISKALQERNDFIDKMYEDLKAIVSDRAYKVYGEDNKEVDAVKVLFSERSKFENSGRILQMLQNRAKLKKFNGYTLNMNDKGLGRPTFFKGETYEEEKTFFNAIEDKDVSYGGLTFVPMKIEEGKLTNYIGNSRDNHIVVNNIYKFIKDFSGDRTSKEYKDMVEYFNSLVKNRMAKKGFSDTFTLDEAATVLGLTDEVYFVLLNVGDKEGLGVAATVTKDLIEGKSFKDFTKYLNDEFANRFIKKYNFSEKDRKPVTIGKRLSTLTHEEQSMFPNLDITTMDYIVQELTTIETYLSKNRANGVGFFTKEQEDIIEGIISKEEPTIEEQRIVVDIFLNNDQIETAGFKKMGGGSEDEITNNIYKSIAKTKNTDGQSYHSNEILSLLKTYQGYIHLGEPAKYHYSKLGEDLNKTSWSPYSDSITESLSEAFFKNKNKLNEQGFNIGATRIVGEESVKLGSTKYTPFTDEKYVIENGVRRRVLGWKESNTKYYKPASEEIYIEDMDISGITKQVSSTLHPAAKVLMSQFELNEVEKTIKEIQQVFLGKGDLPIGSVADFSRFLNTINSKLELGQLPELQRKYVESKMKKLLSYLEKPKEDNLGYRNVFIPRSTYLTADKKFVPVKDNELYVSAERYEYLKSKKLTKEINGELYVMAYRSPVPNSENVTLQKVVIDHSITGMDSVALSPYNVVVLKQADHDGDHLNIVFIQDKTHAGGISSTASYLLFNDGYTNKDELIRTLYSKELTLEAKYKKINEELEKFVTENPNYSHPGVVIKQVDDPEEIVKDEVQDYVLNEDGVLELKQKKKAKDVTFQEANINAMKGQDNISLVAADTRTIILVRDLIWEYKNQDITGVTKEVLRKRMGLETEGIDNKKISDSRNAAWNQFESIIDKQLPGNKEFDSVSGSINQRTLDAPKVGDIPGNWQQLLYKAGFGDEFEFGEDALSRHFGSISMSYNKIYDGDNFFNYFLSYDKKEGEKVLDEYNTIIGYNQLLRDKISDIAKSFDESIGKWTDSMKVYYKIHYNIDYPNREDLATILSKSLKKEDQWMVPLIVNEKVAIEYSPRALKDSNVKNVKTGKQEWFVNGKRYVKDDKGNYVIDKTKKVTLESPSVDELLKMGFKVKQFDTHAPYLQDKFYMKDWVLKENTSGNLKFMDGFGTSVSLPDSKAVKDKLLETVLSKLSNSSVTIKGWGPNKKMDKDITYSKEDIIKILNLHMNKKVEEEYVKHVVAQVTYPGIKPRKIAETNMKEYALLRSTEFLKSNLESDKVPQEIKDRFLKIVENLPDIGDVTSFELNKDTIIINTQGATLVDMNIDLDGRLFKIINTGDSIIIKDETDKVLFGESIEIKSNKNLINEFKSAPFEEDAEIFEMLGVTKKTRGEIERALDEISEAHTEAAIATSSEFIKKYSMKEFLRGERLMSGINNESHRPWNNIRKNFSGLSEKTRNAIDNEIYYISTGKIKPDSLLKFVDPLEKKYIETVSDFYDKYFKDHVIKHNINIPTGYFAGSIMEDFVGLGIGKTYKIGYLEKTFKTADGKEIKGIFNIKDFDEYMKISMGDEYVAPILKNGEIKYSKRVEDMYNQIFERNTLDSMNLGWLNKIRNFAFQVTLGTIGIFNGLITGLVQVPTEILRIISLSGNIPGLQDPTKMSNIIRKYSILHNIGFDSAIKVGPHDLDSPFIQKGTYGFLDNVGKFLFGINKLPGYQKLIEGASGLFGNPLLITDLLLDNIRKTAAISDMLYGLGYRNLDSFTDDLEKLPVFEKERVLDKLRLEAKSRYADISGGVTLPSYIWRETWFSRRKYMVPFTFLMNWSLRLSTTFFEDANIMRKGFQLLATDKDKGLDYIFNKSKLTEKLLKTSLISAGVFVKVNSRDDYEGEFADRKVLMDWVKGLNANLVAISMTLPSKIISAGSSGGDTFEGKISNMLSQMLASTFRELDLFEIVSENSRDWLKGDRESMFDSFMDAILEKATKGLMYNKAIIADGMYSEYRSRNELEGAIGIEALTNEEKVGRMLAAYSKGELIEALIDDGKFNLVILETIRSAPFMSLILKDEYQSSLTLFEKELKKFNKYLTSKDFSVLFNDFETGLTTIEGENNIHGLFSELTSFIPQRDEKGKLKLNERLEAIFTSDQKQLNEVLLTTQLKNKLGADYYNIINGMVDGKTPDTEYILKGILNENDQLMNQLMLKVTSKDPSSMPYVLATLLEQDFYEWKQDMKKASGVEGVREGHTFEQEVEYKKMLISRYQELLKASEPSKAVYSAFLAASARPEFLDTIMSSNNTTGGKYLKDMIEDRLTAQIAISSAFNQGDLTPGLIDTRMGAVTNKLDSKYEAGEISEETYKARIIDLFNYGLDVVHNSNASLDQQIEMKTALISSLGRHAWVLQEDSKIKKGTETARINLMHKLYSTTFDLKPYAEAAKLDLAEKTGQIDKSKLPFYRGQAKSNKGMSPGFGKSLGEKIPQMVKMLNDPRNKFLNAFTPGNSGFKYNPIRSFAPPRDNRPAYIEEFKKILLDQNSLDLIRPTKKYSPPNPYIKVARAENIKVIQKMLSRPPYTPKSKGLLSDLPYNRE